MRPPSNLVPPSIRLAIGLVALMATGLAFAQDQPPVAAKRVALLVGVNRYQKPGLANLRFAENDVQKLAEELKKQGFATKVLLGSSAGDSQATKENIVRFAKDMVKTLGKDDLALVMLSGHGQQIRKTLADGTVREDAYYVPVEGVAGQADTLVSLSQIVDEILAPNVGRKLLLVDACRDVSKEANRGAKGIQGKVISLPEDTAVFFACRAGQQSYEDETLKHGLFTWCLLEGLRGKAARDNEVSWGDLITHVQRRMDSNELRLLVPQGESQRPIAAGGVEHTVLAKIAGKAAGPEGPAPSVPPVVAGDTPKLLTAPFTKAEIKAAQLAWAKLRDKNTPQEMNTIGMSLIVIPAGEFVQGSSDDELWGDEEKQHKVRISKPFRLGINEVTQGEWKAVMATEPWKVGKHVREGANYPVSCICWDDAQEFCKKLSAKEGIAYRLPTESEWEYACRAGSQTVYYFGDDAAQLPAHAWLLENTEKVDEKYPHLVGQKKPNAFGLYDMHGNLSEWCQDWYDKQEYVRIAGQTAIDPTGPATGTERVLRGGNWMDTDLLCRSAYRLRAPSNARMELTGFRVVTPLR